MIYGIKNSILYGKDITKQIDWYLDKKVINISTKVDNMSNDLGELKLKVDIIYNYILSKMRQERKEGMKHSEKEREN